MYHNISAISFIKSYYTSQFCFLKVGISELFTDSGEWSKWTECSRTCGVGRRARARTITTTDSAGKLEQYEQTEIDKCQTYPCPGALNHVLAVSCVINNALERSL